MITLPVNLKKSYDVLIGRNLLSETGKLLATRIKPCKAVLVCDNTVAGLYGDVVSNSLSQAGFETISYRFAPGEASKNPATLISLLEFMAKNEVTRSDLIVALGGGVTGDLAGFAAAVFLRSIRYIQIPTTLLAAVDSSVGGKTAVDLKGGKNLMGAFHQPEWVLCDVDTFSTLGNDLFSDGICEMIKASVIADPGLFDLLCCGKQIDDLPDAIAKSIAVKASLVSQDERDKGVRQLLNLGHTVGHAIEHLSHFTVRHGQAVAAGMAVIARASARAGLCEGSAADAIQQALLSHALPVATPFDSYSLAAAATSDKKRLGKTINLVVPTAIGSCSLHPLPMESLPAFIQLGLEGSI